MGRWWGVGAPAGESDVPRRRPLAIRSDPDPKRRVESRGLSVRLVPYCAAEEMAGRTEPPRTSYTARHDRCDRQPHLRGRTLPPLVTRGLSGGLAADPG